MPHEPWILLSTGDGLTYRKEAIYEGDFGKLDTKGKGLQFSAFGDTLRHWAKSVGTLLSNGIKIPLSRSHDGWELSENKLGEITGAKVGTNAKGKLALFLDIKFSDARSRDIALKADVSVGSPPVWYDGRKRKYNYPLQHVASTAAPVVPGLETWQAIAASHGINAANEDDSDGGTLEMSALRPETLKALAADPAVPPVIRNGAKAMLKSAKTDPLEDEEDEVQQAIAASHSGGGYADWVERKYGK